MLRQMGVILAATLMLVACSAPKTKVEVKEERTFRFASFHPPKDLHPLSGLVGIPLPQLYRHLVWQLTFTSRKPDLLESYEVSKDGKECILYLRKDVRFHDGSLMTAEDIVYTYERLNQHKNRLLLSAGFMPIIQVEIIDQFTIRMRSENTQDWGFILTFPILNAKYEKKWEKKELSAYVPMGTGPYRFVSYDKETQIIKLELFDDFRVGPDAIQKVEIYYFSDPEAATMAILEDRVDYVMGLSPEDAAYVKKHPDLEVFDTVTSDAYQILLNTRVPRLMDENVRRALSLLINRKAIVEDRFGLNGSAVASDALLHFSKPFTTPVARPPNPQKALKLFAEAGWIRKNGKLERGGKQFRLEILMAEHNNRFLPAIRKVISTWEDAGISCALRRLNVNDFFDSGKAGKFEAMFTELTDTLKLLMNSIYWESGSDWNYVGLADPGLDNLFSQIRINTSEPPLSVKQAMQQKLGNLTPTIVLFYIKNFGVLNKRFKLDVYILNDPYGLYYLADARQ